MQRLSENGELVLVTEQLVCDGQNQRQRIILRVKYHRFVLLGEVC